MSLMRMPWTVRGQFVSGAAMVAIFCAGCGTVANGPGDLFGTVINTNKSTDLLGGVRLRSEEAVFAFGTFQPDGSVGEVTSIVYRDTGGAESTLYLESGRPSRAIGADGSRLEILYEEVSTQRLKGQVTVTPAGGQAQVFTFDVDLLKTAQEVAQLVQDLTGVSITDQAPPDTSARTNNADRPTEQAPTDRTVVILVPVVLVVTGFTLNLVLSQILQNMLLIATGVVKSLLVGILTPFIVMGNLMRLALGQPLVTLEYDEYDIEQHDLVLTIPRPRPF